MFYYNSFDRREKERYCIFSDLKNCGEKVSSFICNQHSVTIFNLIYKYVDYTDGDNNTESRIVMYYTSASSRRIPLFLLQDGTVDLMAIKSFCEQVKSHDQRIDIDKMQTIISCLVGLTANPVVCGVGGWLDSPSSFLLQFEKGEPLRYRDSLPRLHLMLFYYAFPSLTVVGADEYVTRLENMIYTVHGNTGEFIITNKSLLLRYTSLPNCVATPIVLGAVYKCQAAKEKVEFLPLNRLTAMSC